MSNSPLVNNVTSAVQTALTNKGAPAMYGPDLNYLIVQVLTELSTDSIVPSDAQSVFSTQVALAATDAAP